MRPGPCAPNPFTYVNGNPINLNDPSGHDPHVAACDGAHNYDACHNYFVTGDPGPGGIGAREAAAGNARRYRAQIAFEHTAAGAHWQELADRTYQQQTQLQLQRDAVSAYYYSFLPSNVAADDLSYDTSLANDPRSQEQWRYVALHLERTKPKGGCMSDPACSWLLNSKIQMGILALAAGSGGVVDAIEGALTKEGLGDLATSVAEESLAGSVPEAADLSADLAGPDVSLDFQDPASPPGEGWEWRGPDSPGGEKGGWFKPETRETLHPDLSHPDPIGPHYDWRAPDGTFYRIYPDGTVAPK